ncbi:glutamine synthetase [Streptomyces sp. V4-01]|uniref:Glutamine synthetase n=1 Tax=Actinacidiphila polyblastidii TaxID=3110430 RepID=A0ABU7PEC8_9ACTN|nr:glutamine synthetase [Streptomyces sp. V4-01]
MFTCRSEGVIGPKAQAAWRGCNFLRNKKQEWEEYRSEVTAFELRKNLPVL